MQHHYGIDTLIENIYTERQQELKRIGKVIDEIIASKRNYVTERDEHKDMVKLFITLYKKINKYLKFLSAFSFIRRMLKNLQTVKSAEKNSKSKKHRNRLQMKSF